MNTSKTAQSQEQHPQTRTEAGERASSGCCGGPAPEGSEACCALDAKAKAGGAAGCGCAGSAKKSCC